MTITFRELGLPAPLVDALASQGLTEPFPIQLLTIGDALAGRDVCGKAKTGSGKTLAFGLPLLSWLGEQPAAESNRPRALVLLPTRELALQVSQVLTPLAAVLDRRVAAVYGGADMGKQRKALEAGADLVVATPGRLIDLTDDGSVRLDDVITVVLDEADRMVDMGFLPQVEWLLRKMPNRGQTLLFSATLDGAIDHVARTYLRDPVRHEVASRTVTVDEMVHRFLLVHQLDKAKVAAALCRANRRTLVFTNTKRAADALVRDLRREGVEVEAIHGDLRQRDREKALQGFAEGTLPALVATDVAARGLHIDAVDAVLQFDPTEDHKNYLHRAGRTARAGESGLVVTLVLWNEELAVRRMQKRLGLVMPIVEMFSNDARLADLSAWQPDPNEGVGIVARRA